MPREHIMDASCWCEPRVHWVTGMKEHFVLVHRADDGSEPPEEIMAEAYAHVLWEGEGE